MPIKPTSSSLPVVIVIAAHGAPAMDYPRGRVGLLLALEMTIGRLPLINRWQRALDQDVRNWPRTGKNDPYKSAVDDLANRLNRELGCPVFVGYNEFCNPTLAQALDAAAQTTDTGNTILVVPTMLLRGNQHNEEEIRQTIVDAQTRFPNVKFHYAWPFAEQDIVAMFANHLRNQAQALKSS